MYIDIHTHILPGLDDGASNQEEMGRMLKIAYENQITEMIVTPHNKANRHNPSVDTIKKSAVELQKYVEEKKYGIKIYSGTEAFYRSDLVELLKEKRVCTMADSSYVLVEFSPMDDYAYIRDGLYNLASGGYRPIVAHVERYQCLMKNHNRVDELIGMGCYMQVNVGSITGRFGFNTKSDAKKLLKNGRVHFIATDAHNDEKRAPEMEKCIHKLLRRYEETYMEDLVWNNARKVIANEYI